MNGIRYQLEDIETFLQVAETGSITQAAERLCVSKSVISKRIVRLEHALGIALLHRSTRGVTLTDKGQAFHGRAQRILEDLHLAADEVAEQGHELSGQLRIAGPLSFGSRYLGKLLFPFMEHHPRLQLALDLEDRTVDMVREGYDLAVRVTRTPALELRARQLAVSQRIVCCSPAFAERHGRPDSLEALAQLPAIGYSNVSASQLWQFEPEEPGGDVRALAMRGRVTVNNGESACDAAIAGLGVVMVPLFIAARGLRSGELIPVLPTARPLADAIYAVYPQTRYVSRAVRAVIDYLVTAMSEAPPWERDLPFCLQSFYEGAPCDGPTGVLAG